MGDMKIKKIDPTQIKYEPQEGEVIQTPDGVYMIYHDGWHILDMRSSGIEMGLYDMNKQIIDQLPVLEGQELADKMIGIAALHDTFKNKYYMMYGKEISYFTVFEIIEDRYFPDEVIDCLRYVGDIKAIDAASDAMEIWVQTEDGPTCLYLFPYDSGIVRVGE